MRRPNPLPPDLMTAAERRAELCGLLALGLLRLKRRIEGDVVSDAGDVRLHCPPRECRHATPTHEETA